MKFSEMFPPTEAPPRKLTPEGYKDQQREDNEDRSIPFRQWNRRLGGCPCADIDLVHWRKSNGVYRPVLVIEEQRYDYNPEYPNGPNPGYFLSVRRNRALNDEWCIELHKLLGCPAVFILWREDLSELWSYNIVDYTDWTPRTFPEFAAMLRAL